MFYRDVLRRLRDAVRRKRPELWSTGNWRLHHDNDPGHSSHLIKTFFGEKPDFEGDYVSSAPSIPVFSLARRSDTFLTLKIQPEH